MTQTTLQQVFETQAQQMGVIVLRGVKAGDGHASHGETPEYVMLPGGGSDDDMYAAGLHELGHVAVNRARGASFGNIDRMADDILSGKRDIVDVVQQLVSTTDQTLRYDLARATVARLALAPLGAYADVVDDEQQAWAWATAQVNGKLSNAQWAAFEANRVESLQTYVAAAAHNAGDYYAYMAQDGRDDLKQRMDTAVRGAVKDYAQDKDAGCGTCPSCVARKERTARAEALYAQTVNARAAGGPGVGGAAQTPNQGADTQQQPGPKTPFYDRG